MGSEIERKFLVKSADYKEAAVGMLIKQGYLSSNPSSTVRVRLVGNKGFITVKGKMFGVTRLEFEYEIPVEDAEQMLESLCEKPIIEKCRYRYTMKQHIWEVDEFYGENDGLIVAEIELNDENEDFEKPSWIGSEVTDDYRYLNSNLIKHPYRDWRSI